MTEQELPFTLQQTLDRVVDYLLAGGKRSVLTKKLSNTKNHFSCAYRGADGVSQCFVGLMLTDEQASRVETLPADEAFNTLFALGYDSNLSAPYEMLQETHDSTANWDGDGTKFNEDGWQDLRRWAEFNKLKWPEVANDMVVS